MMTGDAPFWFVVGLVGGMAVMVVVHYVAIRFSEWRDLGEAYRQPQQVRINTLHTPLDVMRISVTARVKRFLAMVGIALLLGGGLWLVSELL